MRICYFNYTKNIHARDAVYLKGLRENDVEIIECRDSSPGWIKYWHLYRQHRVLRDKYDILMVGYTGHVLVPFARLISRKKIIFNALSSLYEGIVISRGKKGPFYLRAIYSWLIDFVAFHTASLSLIESNGQKEYLAKKFLLKKDKLLVAWTGADDSIFYYDPNIKKLQTFTVLFRGGFLPESGIEYAIEAAKILKNENINFRIIGWGMMESKVRTMLNSFDSSRVEWIKEKLPIEKLRGKMQETHLSLGQLSRHPRLERTIPHKAFETIAMRLPYLTARNKAVMELLTEGETCLTCNSADAKGIGESLKQIADWWVGDVRHDLPGI